MSPLAREPCGPYEAIIDVLWGDDPDGGPMNTRMNIQVYAARLRTRYGRRWKLTTIPGYGLMIEKR